MPLPTGYTVAIAQTVLALDTPRAGAQLFEADLVIVNANLHTLDASRPVAEAVS